MLRKTDYSNEKLYRKQKYQPKKNNQKTKIEVKNNCIDISSNKQVKSHTRKLGYG